MTSEPACVDAGFVSMAGATNRGRSEDDAAAQLAQRAAAGDRAAQRELFHELKTYLHATLYRVLGSNAQMEDLLQDTFIEVYRSLPSYRAEAKLSTWADRIAVRVAYRYLERERAARRGVAAAEPSPLATVDDELLHREGVRRAYEVLARLEPRSRIAFALFAIDGRSLREVADVLGASLVATKSRIWRARRELTRAALSDGVLARYLGGEES